MNDTDIDNQAFPEHVGSQKIIDISFDGSLGQDKEYQIKQLYEFSPSRSLHKNQFQYNTAEQIDYKLPNNLTDSQRAQLSAYHKIKELDSDQEEVKCKEIDNDMVKGVEDEKYIIKEQWISNHHNRPFELDFVKEMLKRKKKASLKQGGYSYGHFEGQAKNLHHFIKKMFKVKKNLNQSNLIYMPTKDRPQISSLSTRQRCNRKALKSQSLRRKNFPEQPHFISFVQEPSDQPSNLHDLISDVKNQQPLAHRSFFLAENQTEESLPKKEIKPEWRNLYKEAIQTQKVKAPQYSKSKRECCQQKECQAEIHKSQASSRPRTHFLNQRTQPMSQSFKEQNEQVHIISRLQQQSQYSNEHSYDDSQIYQNRTFTATHIPGRNLAQSSRNISLGSTNRPHYLTQKQSQQSEEVTSTLPSIRRKVNMDRIYKLAKPKEAPQQPEVDKVQFYLRPKFQKLSEKLGTGRIVMVMKNGGESDPIFDRHFQDVEDRAQVFGDGHSRIGLMVELPDYQFETRTQDIEEEQSQILQDKLKTLTTDQDTLPQIDYRNYLSKEDHSFLSLHQNLGELGNNRQKKQILSKTPQNWQMPIINQSHVRANTGKIRIQDQEHSTLQFEEKKSNSSSSKLNQITDIAKREVENWKQNSSLEQYEVESKSEVRNLFQFQNQPIDQSSVNKPDQISSIKKEQFVERLARSQSAVRQSDHMKIVEKVTASVNAETNNTNMKLIKGTIERTPSYEKLRLYYESNYQVTQQASISPKIAEQYDVQSLRASVDNQSLEAFTQTDLQIFPGVTPADDWSRSDLYAKFISQLRDQGKSESYHRKNDSLQLPQGKRLIQDTSSSPTQDVYSEIEVNYILSTLKKSSPNKKKVASEDIQTAYERAYRTLLTMMQDLNLPSEAISLQQTKYSEGQVSIKDCIKMLVRTKQMFESKQQLLKIFRLILKREVARGKGEEVGELGRRILGEIETLQMENQLFGRPFVIEKVDYVKRIRQEMLQ